MHKLPRRSYYDARTAYLSSINEPSIYPRLKSINQDLMTSYSYKVTEKKQITIDRYLIR